MTEYGNLNFSKQKNGNLKGILYYYDAAGKRHNISKTSQKKKVKEAKAELQAWADEMREQGKRGISLNPRKQGETVEAIITRYLDTQMEKGKI